jgi:transposase
MQRLKIENPNTIKKQIYSYLNSSKEAKFIHRLHGLLLMIDNESNNCENIAGLFNNSSRTVSNWVHKINENNNIDILKDKKKPGRKTRLNTEQLNFIKESLIKHPGKFGLNANIWSGKVLSHFIKDQFGIELKVRQCQRLFHKLEFSLKRARPMPVKGDEKKKEAFKKN